MSGWQPIETAPKDGTPILLCWSDEGHYTNYDLGPVWLGCWHSIYSTWTTLSLHQITMIENRMSDEALEDVVTCDSPTHWQPLPEPPK